jgi:hypothetical protein
VCFVRHQQPTSSDPHLRNVYYCSRRSTSFSRFSSKGLSFVSGVRIKRRMINLLLMA